MKQELANEMDKSRGQSDEISALKLQNAAMHNQMTGFYSAATKIKILRLFLVFAGMGLFLAPGSLAVATAVMGIVAIMFLVKI